MFNRNAEAMPVNEELQAKLQRHTFLGGVPRGTIVMFAGKTLPNYWRWCDGTDMVRADSPMTFNCIGTSFGEGDGNATFNLPNLPDPAPGIRFIIKVEGFDEKWIQSTLQNPED